MVIKMMQSQDPLALVSYKLRLCNIVQVETSQY